MFKSPSMPIGTNDFTLEYFGNLYGAISSNTPLIFNANAPYAYSKGCLLVYGTPQIAFRWIIFEKPSSGDMLLDSINLIEGVQESILHIALTRKGTTVKIYINGELKATKEQSAVKDLGDFRLGMSNGSNMVMSRIYNYALSAEEAAALYNDGDPAGYVLPIPYKYKVANYISDFSKNTDGWSTVANYPGTSLNSGDGILSIYGDSTTLAIQKQGLSSGDKPGIFRIRIVFVEPFQGSSIRFFAHSFNDYADLTLSSEKLNAEGVVHIKKASNIVPNSFMYSYDVPIGDVVKISTITIESIGCVAEYLPKNLVADNNGIAISWLDSAKQLPLNDEYLPPLFESIVIGDATPIHITGENSYTWTGADDSTYGKLIPISRTLNVGSRYRISVTVSDYEAGSPFINISGTDSASIPSANGTYELELAYTADYPNRIILYGGQSGTDRRLTLTVNSIEPIVEHSYDLTANGMPQIIIK